MAPDSTPPPALIARLAELEATLPGRDWWYDGHGYVFYPDSKKGQQMVAQPRGFGAGLPVNVIGHGIAEMRNMLAPLLSLLRAKDERIAKLDAEAERYAKALEWIVNHGLIGKDPITACAKKALRIGEPE